MLRGLLSVIINMVLCTQLYAQSDGQFYSGYRYPMNNTLCSPVCTGAKVTIQVPHINPVDVVSDLVWLGVSDRLGGSSKLGQFGIEITSIVSGAPVWAAWYELFPDQSIQQIGGFSVNDGDVIELSMTCSANCTPSDAGQQWDISIINRTNGNTYSDTKNWPLKMDRVFAVVEEIGGVGGNVNNFGTQRFSNFQVQQSGTFSPVVLQPAGALWAQGSNFVMSSGPAIGLAGNDFNVCKVAGATGFTACASGPYSGLSGLGP